MYFKRYGVIRLGDTRVEIILGRDPQDQLKLERGPKVPEILRTSGLKQTS